VLAANKISWRRRVLIRLEAVVFVNKCYKVFFWILLLMYPAASVLVLKMFHCVQVGPHWYLQADMSLLCYSPRWQLYFPVALMGVFMCALGVPALFFVLLWRARNQNVKEQWAQISSSEQGLRRWLKMALADPDCTKLKHEELKHRHSKQLVTSFLKLRNMRYHTTTTRLGFIYAAYTPSLWWFEIEELFRKLLLNGAMVFVHPDKPPAQLMTGALICVAAVMLLLFLHPYPRQSDQHSAIAAQTQLCLSMLLALALIAGIGLFSDSAETESMVTTVLITVSCVINVLFILGEYVAEFRGALHKTKLHVLSHNNHKAAGRAKRGVTLLSKEVCVCALEAPSRVQ
jgi:hypothetical protein